MKGQNGSGQLTEDFEHSDGISNASGASGNLAVEGELVGGSNRGDGQGEVLSNSDPLTHRGAVIAFSLAILGAESYTLSGSLLLLKSMDRQKEIQKEDRRVMRSNGRSQKTKK